MLFWRARLPLLIHHHFMRRQTKPKSVSKQRINSDAIFFICSTRLRAVNSSMTGGDGWQVLQWPLEWPCSVTFHILPVSLLPGVAESPPPALSESTVRIHETNHSSASWETASDSRGRHGCPPLWPSSTGDWGGKAKLSNTLRSAGSLFWPCKRISMFYCENSSHNTHKPQRTSLPIDEYELLQLQKRRGGGGGSEYK